MNEIIRALIEWTQEYQVSPEIYFYSSGGGIWLVLKLRSNGRTIRHDFYFAGGVLSIENWDFLKNSEELKNFVKDTLTKFGKDTEA